MKTRRKFKSDAFEAIDASAPALKGEELCYQHAAQAEASARREAAVKSLGIPSRIASARGLQTAISRIARLWWMAGCKGGGDAAGEDPGGGSGLADWRAYP